MAHLYIIRGLPGSGKSTIAKRMVSSGFVDAHFEADMWMTNEEGEYEFHPDRLSYCHNSCFNVTCGYLREGLTVAVSNTFTTDSEMKQYTEFCEQNNIPFSVIVVENRHGNSSVHDVPESTMQRMCSRFSIKL